MNLPRTAILSVVVGGCASWLALAADPPAAPDSGLAVARISQWKFEEMQLDNGRTLRGLIVAEDPESIGFMEIRRPPGRPMNLVMGWRYPRANVVGLAPLPPDQRQILVNRMHEFMDQRRETEEEMSDVRLQRVGPKEATTWHYESRSWLMPNGRSWLVLDSTTDEEMTRRSIVQIEQVFAAYREILPPRVKPRRPLELRLYGTMREYNDFQRGFKLSIQNPAMFVSGQNLLGAGSELSEYARQLALVRGRNAEILNDCKQQTALMPARLLDMRQQLAAGGVPADEQRKDVLLAENLWTQHVELMKNQVRVAERLNIEKFHEATDRMFTRLYHEAFHAYLENYVYPHDEYDVPRWLNEGLAQIFEGGQLESGTLRLDAPQAERLKELQDDIRTQPRLPLAELLAADERSFLIDHPGGAGASKRHYLYSWGLAYYLTFRQPLLETTALDRYVDHSAATLSPVQRFERLVGISLGQFERTWRREMLALKTRGPN